MINNEIDIDALVWYHIHKFIRENDVEGHLNQKDDLYSEARITALRAVAKFDAKKGAKLSTFIFECVKNYFKDRSDYESIRPHQFESLHTENEDGDHEERFCGITDSRDIEFDLTMRAILTKNEYDLYYKKIVMGYSIREIASTVKEREVLSCTFQSILRKFESLEKSQEQILTRRSHQDKWLNASQD
jgi:DNA-directed RNA polymerase specialized sigma24 family protein